MDHSSASPVPPSSSPYASRGPGGPAGLPWYRVLVRIVLVVVLGQLVGTLLAVLLLVPVDLTAHPRATALLWVVPGVLAGVGLGLLLRPGRTWPWRLAGAAALVCVLCDLLLVALGQARAGISGPAASTGLVRGLLGGVVVQTVLAVGLWLLRRRRAGR